MLFRTAERQHASIVALEVAFDVHPIHVLDQHTLSCLPPIIAAFPPICELSLVPAVEPSYARAMRSLRLMRGLSNGIPGLLLAALLLLSRLVGPALALPAMSGDPISSITQTICHTDEVDGTPTPTDPSDHRSCLLCPACHLVAHAALPVPLGPIVPLPTGVAISVRVSLPPAQAPPSRIRTAAQPTGPPTLSA